MNLHERVRMLAEELQPELVALRRDLHKYAEAGWTEMRTSSLVARHLTELGYQVLVGEQVCKRDARMGVPAEEVLEEHYQRAAAQGADPEFLPYTKGGMTGVIGILKRGEGPTVAMRFDIDALGVAEQTQASHFPAQKGFASANPGVMHACGHDGHTAIGVGVAKILMELKEHLHGTVKLIFQPAEEGVRGGKAIVENGHLENVDYFIGAHITGKGPEEPAFITPGSHGSLATSKYDVIYRGTSAHAGASPHLGSNAMLAAASAVLNLHAIPRHGDGVTRINVGTLRAGSGRNVIPDEAVMEIEVRGQTTALNRYMCDCAERIIRAAAAMYGCTCDIRLMGAADSLTSDLTLAERIQGVCREKLRIECTDTLSVPSFGSEDIAYMMNRVQEQGGEATFMRALTPISGPVHSRCFDFDEKILHKSVAVFCGTVVDILS